MATFTPPANATEVPPVLPVGDPEQSALGFRLFRFYRARPAGRNVYMYKAGSVSATAFGRVTETDPTSTYNSSGVATSNGWDDIEIVFYGGHGAVTVTSAQATALTNAGYTVV